MILQVKNEAGEWVEITALKGEKGDTGATGEKGDTPIKGTDYYTEADKQEMVELVLAAVTNGEEVSY